MNIVDDLRKDVSIDLEVPQALALFLSPRDLSQRIETTFRPFVLGVQPSRGGVRLSGDSLAVSLAEKGIRRVESMASQGEPLNWQTVEAALNEIVGHALRYEFPFRLEGVPQAIQPLNLGQLAFMNELLSGTRPLVFGVGPTGTGKSHLALAASLNFLARGVAKHLILTRPSPLAEGESMTPSKRADATDEGQLTPLEDELEGVMGRAQAENLEKAGRVMVLPLGRLRGRTFTESILLIDDAQNLTVGQMRMALTRLGRGSRAIVLGDPTHTDLPSLAMSGLAHILPLIEGSAFASIHRFEPTEIVRNPLVAELEKLYAQEDGSGRAFSAA